MIATDKAATSKALATAVVIALFAGGTALAQSPPDAGRLLEETQKSVPVRPATKPRLQIPVPVEPPMQGAKEARLFVKGFTFSMDAAVAGDGELQQVVKEYTNREVTFAELEQAAEKVAGYLRSKGYFLAKAYLPKQQIEGGMVRIAILVGRVESQNGNAARLEGERPRLRATVANGILNSAIKVGEPARLADFERGVLLINDLPQVTAATNLSAGSTPGTTRLAARVTEGELFSGMVSADSFGNRYTGAGRFVGALNINDPTGFGDQISLSGVQAGEPVFDTNHGWMHMWRVGWQFPIGFSGLRGGVAYSSLDYRIGEELENTLGKGSAQTWSGNLTYPLIRSRDYNLYASASYEYRSLYNDLGGDPLNDKRVHSGTASLQGDALDSLLGGGYTSYGVAFTRGNLDLSRMPSYQTNDAATLRANGGYSKLSFNGSRQQNLSRGYTLFGALSGQVSDKNLDSSEQITLGGPTGVRAYPTGEGTGDSGVVVNLELRKELPDWTRFAHLQAFAFFDYGWVQQHSDTWAGWNAGNPGLKNGYDLSGAGVGLNVGKTARYLVKAFWAAEIGNNPGRSAAGNDSDGKNLGNRVWVQGSLFF